MSSKNFRCELCSNTFYSGWSDEEAKQEYFENFPDTDESDFEDAAVICDDCYRMMMTNPNAYRN